MVREVERNEFQIFERGWEINSREEDKNPFIPTMNNIKPTPLETNPKTIIFESGEGIEIDESMEKDIYPSSILDKNRCMSLMVMICIANIPVGKGKSNNKDDDKGDTRPKFFRRKINNNSHKIVGETGKNKL